MQIVSLGNNLHEMSNPIFWKKKKRKNYQYVKMSVEFAQFRFMAKVNFSFIVHEVFQSLRKMKRWIILCFTSISIVSELLYSTVFDLITTLYAQVFQNYWKKKHVVNISIHPTRHTLNKDQQRTSRGAHLMIFMWFYFSFVKAYVVGTHLNSWGNLNEYP